MKQKKQKSLRLFFAIWGLAMLASCARTTLPPEPFGPIPSEAQLDWQKMEYNMFIHFGPNTFTGMEWGNGKEDPGVFNPSDLDCRQWASIARQAGMKGIVITAKHHDGFCLWPSKFSSHTVRESPWKQGKGDVLKELSDACKEYGLKFGVYLSPWDQNHPSYGTPDYNAVFMQTQEEVLTSYGDVFEQWFDGANGEGKDGKKQVYDWKAFNQTVYQYQPGAVIFSDVGPGCRWIGNEEGYAGETNWSRLDIEGYEPGSNSPDLDTLNAGNMQGAAWVPAEANTSIRPGWFYSPDTDQRVKSLAKLVDVYYSSVGRNATFLLNVPPDRTGRIHPNDSARLMELRHAIETSFALNLAKGRIVAGNTRGNDKRYEASNLLDDNYDAYWATDDDVLTSGVELDLGEKQQFNCILLQEYIPLGQRVARFRVSCWDDASGAWKELAEATTIGYKRILRFPPVTSAKVRVDILHSLASPVLNKLELYLVPDYIENENSADGLTYQTHGMARIVLPTTEGIQSIVNNELKTPVYIPEGQHIVVDLGEELPVGGFSYTPEARVAAANIARFRLEVSADNKSWAPVETEGLFQNIRNNPVRQVILFPGKMKARYLRLIPTELTNPGAEYAVAGLSILL